MSVYSGFSTRQMESQYNYLTKTLLIILAKRVNKIYTQKPTNEEAFKQILLKVLCNMSLMERHKYMQPKYTENILSLVEIFSPDQFLSLSNNKTPNKALPNQQLLRPAASQPPLIQFEKKQQDQEYNTDMPKPPVFCPIVSTFQHNHDTRQDQEQGQIQLQIKQTQDQINNLQSNLNQILASQQYGTLKETQRVSNKSIDNYNPGRNFINQDSANHMKTNQSSRNPQNFLENNLKPEEVHLIENMLKLRKVEKITKKRKIKKFKKKKCTFEKLLIEFYDDDSKDMSSESEKIKEKQFYSNNIPRRDQNFQINQGKPQIRIRTNSLYR